MTQHVHFDLDAVERDIRKMFAQMEQTQRHPNVDPLIFKWQNRTVDIAVAFIKFGMRMQMEGVEPEAQAFISGVVLAELAAQVLNGYTGDPEAIMQAASIILDGFTGHLNVNIQRCITGEDSDAKVVFDPVAHGTA